VVTYPPIPIWTLSSLLKAPSMRTHISIGQLHADRSCSLNRTVEF